MVLASIPSPAQAVWHLGPIPLRAYALAIILGIVIAWWWMDKRYRAKGGPEDVSVDVAMWAVFFGILGGRLYHVITDYQLYFAPGKDPIKALFIWEGGLGNLGCRCPWRRGCLFGGAPPRPEISAVRRFVGSCSSHRAGNRTVRQLLQSGTLRTAHGFAVGPRD